MKTCRLCRYFYHGHKREPSLCTNRHSKKFPNKVSKNGHDHICSLFRPIKNHHSSDVSTKLYPTGSHHHPDSILKRYGGKIRLIESLKGIYAGREIWVLATGPSLDDIPTDFLKVDEAMPPDDDGNRPPKISIAVKEAAIVFPDCTYNIWPFRNYELRHIYIPRGQIPAKFGKFILTLRDRDRENYFGKQVYKPTYLKFSQGGTIEQMRGMCDAILAGNSSIYYGVGTITHLAIAAALVMGAKKISLIGCEHGVTKEKMRAQVIKGGYGWQTDVGQGYEMMKVGTNFLADYFKDKVEIVRYYHGKGYEKIGEAIEDKEIIEEAEKSWENIIEKGHDWEKEKEILEQEEKDASQVEP